MGMVPSFAQFGKALYFYNNVDGKVYGTRPSYKLHGNVK